MTELSLPPMFYLINNLEIGVRSHIRPPFYKGRVRIRPPEACPQLLFEKEGVGGVPAENHCC